MTSTVVAGTGRFHHEFQRSARDNAGDPETYSRLNDGLFDYGLVVRSDPHLKLLPHQNHLVQSNVNILGPHVVRRLHRL